MAAARLSIVATTLLALFGLLTTNTSAYRTTITTVEIEGSRQQCQQEILMQDMNHCEQYVIQQSRSRGGRSGGENVLAMTTDPDDKSEQFKPCCQELEQLHEECQCPALAQMVYKQMQQGYLQGEKVFREVVQKLQNLPQECQVGSQQCLIRGSSTRWF